MSARVLMACAMILCICSHDTTAISVNVKCKVMCQIFTANINSATEKTSNTICANNAVCTNSRMKLLVSSLTSLHPNSIQLAAGIDDEFTMTVDETSLSELMVLSMLGRLVTKQDAIQNEQSYPHYVFNENANVLQPRFDNCKFEKDMYVTLLCVTIVILITSLTLTMEQKIKQEPSNNNNKDTPKQAFGEPSAALFTLNQNFQPNIRYRSVPTA